MDRERQKGEGNAEEKVGKHLGTHSLRVVRGRGQRRVEGRVGGEEGGTRSALKL